MIANIRYQTREGFTSFQGALLLIMNIYLPELCVERYIYIYIYIVEEANSVSIELSERSRVIFKRPRILAVDTRCQTSGAASSFEETLNTLKYANRAKNIKTNATRNSLDVNHHITEYVNLIGSLRSEITRLKHQLLRSGRGHCGAGNDRPEVVCGSIRGICY